MPNELPSINKDFHFASLHVIFSVLDFCMKNIKSHVLGHNYWSSDVRISQWLCLFTHVDMAFVAYRHDVEGKNLTLWPLNLC